MNKKLTKIHLVTVGCVFVLASESNVVTAFSVPSGTILRQQQHGVTKLFARSETNNEIMSKGQQIVISSVLCASLLLIPQSSIASEIGVEVEAPTFITGETVEICTKRGILGACLQTEMRNEKNDNDIAKKYFKNIEKRDALMASENIEGNALIQKLRQQSIDNAEKNNLLVQRKTFENDQSAILGPFDRQVLIMNTDGKTFTLLQNPQAMRLKRAGFIDERRQFIKQPTEEDLERALSSEGDGFFSNLFGGN